MSGKTRLFYNAALLTASSLLMRGIAMVWQVQLSRRIGPESMGLFQLVKSVDVLFITVAISGIRLAVMRLVAEELGRGRSGSVGKTVRAALGYALFFGLLAAALLSLLAETVALRWAGDGRMLPALRLLPWSFPAVGTFSVLSGYFTAVGRVWKTAAEQLGEQLLRIGLSLLFLASVSPGDSGGCALAMVRADVITDNVSVPVMLLVYALDRRRYRSGRSSAQLVPRMLRLAAPLALSAYARSALDTFRQLLVPKGLRLTGLGAQEALAGYGVVTGMILPMLAFPACLPAALAELLLPELTERQSRGEGAGVSALLRRVLRGTFFLSLGLGAAFFVGADALVGLLYPGTEGAGYLRLMAPLTPFLYTDVVLSGCLRGLGEMDFVLGTELAEALSSLVLMALLLPRWGLEGYILSLLAGELLRFILSAGRIRRFC